MKRFLGNREEIRKSRSDFLMDDTTHPNLESRQIAEDWAQSVMSEYKSSIRSADEPYIRATLIEIALFERPIQALSVGFNDHGNQYVITVKGYRKLFSIRQMYHVFLADDRHADLQNIIDVFQQNTEKDGPVIRFDIGKVNLKNTMSKGSVTTKRRRDRK